MNREHKKHVAELGLIRQRIEAVLGIIADIKPHKDALVVAAAAGDGGAIKKLDRLRAAEAELAGASSSRLWARVSHGRSLRWRRNRGGRTGSVSYGQLHLRTQW
jgi:hypothetical protein